MLGKILFVRTGGQFTRLRDARLNEGTLRRFGIKPDNGESDLALQGRGQGPDELYLYRAEYDSDRRTATTDNDRRSLGQGSFANSSTRSKGRSSCWQTRAATQWWVAATR